MNEVEICCGSYEDGITAWNAGAKRIELNTALSLGGLTCSLAELRKLKEETGLEINCMVRPRGAGFHYTEKEKLILFEEAKLLLDNGADGIVFGFLRPDRTIDEEAVKKMTSLIHSYGKKAIFHRAFDVTPNADEAMKKLIELGIDRVLTSGQRDKAEDGMHQIKHLQKHFGNEIEIQAGSGINSSNVSKILKHTGVHEIHSSCRRYFDDPTTKSSHLSFGYLPGQLSEAYEGVSSQMVEDLLQAVENCS